jgi:DNA (cytosine-5)-methyltransferase 1
MKFIELFAGIGAFRLGLENTGHECVWANEWLEKPRKIYARNFGEQPDGRDIRTISAGDIPNADLLVGGFPCATFSIAGKRTGFSLEDTRGTLAFEMFRLARDKGIPYLLFENVKGLLNHDGGRTFGIILEVLDGMGYDCQWELLDSQNFGVPQHRERIFLIGHLRGEPRPKVFPIGITGGENDDPYQGKQRRRQGLFSDISPTLDAHYYKGGASRPYVMEDVPEFEVAQWRRGYFRPYKSKGVPTLTANMGTGGHNVPFVKPIMDVARFNKSPNGRMIKDDNDPMYTVTAQDRHGVVIGDEESVSIRKLTPLECERLQGFPDGWTEFYDDGKKVSDAERYERCGRTISIPVVEAIGRKLHEFY